MAGITPGVVTPVSGAYGTNPAYSGTFIPTIWSSKLNWKFYAKSVFADICNRNWEGDISNLGDKVIINNIPTLAINDYAIGQNLSYQTPVPNTIELVIDRAKYFGFNVADVLEYQSKPELFDMFSNDAAEQMRIVIDSTCFYRTFNQCVAANRGTTAGVKSASINLGTDAAPIAINSTAGSADNVLTKILEMAAVLDEQNVPDSERYLVIDPRTRTLLMNTNLAQAQFMGDDTSMVRNGRVGKIDRFDVYISNQLPIIPASGTLWLSGDGSENTVTAVTNAARRRAIIAGHRSALSFANQMTKTEQLPNPTDFGKLVRGLNVFGHRATKPDAFALMVVS